MKIYAVRDRLINYYMQPFAAPGDKEVLAALAQQINNEDDKSAISQAPHHFEIWRLGEVDEKGDLIQDKEFLSDAASLVRPSVRREPERRADEAASAYNNHQNAPRSPDSGKNTAPGAIPRPSEAKDPAPPEIPAGPAGSTGSLSRQ